MKKYCPSCKRFVKMRERLEDLDENTDVFVRALVCTECGESLTDVHEYERAQKELMDKNVLKIRRQIIKIGNSSVLRIPSEVLKQAGLKLKESVDVHVNKKHQIVVESRH